MLQLSILGGGSGNSRGFVSGVLLGCVIRVIRVSLWGFFSEIRSCDHVEGVEFADILDRLGSGGLVWSRVLD